MMDSNQHLFNFLLQALPLLLFLALDPSASHLGERMVSWTKACQLQILYFFRQFSDCTYQSGTFVGTITMVPPNNKIWDSVLS